MKNILTLLPAFYAGNIQPGTLTSTCSLDGTVQVDFAYEPADMALDYAFVGESNSTTCGHGSNQVSLSKIDNTAGTWRITYNRNTCGFEGDIMMANTTVSFSDGRQSGSNFLAMRRQAIDVVCRYDTFYTVQYDFSLNKTLEEYDATAFTSGGLQFRLNGFSDAARTSDLSTETLYSGTPVYLTLSAVVAPELVSQLNFAPSKCVFRKTGEINQSFTLFESTVNNCDQGFTDLDFSLDFQASDRTWDISYRLFTFGEDSASAYSIECDVFACYTADGMEACRAVAEQCDDNYSDNEDLWSPSSGGLPAEATANGEQWTEIYNGKFIHISSPGLTFDEGNAYCQNLGAKMAIPESTEENEAVYAVVRSVATQQNEPRAWLGVRLAAAHYRVDGESLNYTPWCNGQPDRGSQECVLWWEVYEGSCWHDVHCTYDVPRVACEYSS